MIVCPEFWVRRNSTVQLLAEAPVVLDRKWISLSAVLALATLVGPIVALAADSSRRSYSSYTPLRP